MNDDAPAAKRTDVLGRRTPEADGCLLTVVAGPDTGRHFELVRGQAVVGADESCDLVLTDGAVSSRHLEVSVTPHGLKVVDLGSTNGTYYLETELREAVLHHGAVVVLGRSRLLLASRPPEAAEQAHDAGSPRARYGDIVGESAAMRKMYARLEKLEAVDYPVLLLGETGVGKEIVAREIHRHSRRAEGPYEILDCAGVSPGVVASELFGHVKGAFTGASQDHPGVFERAHGGTVFIAEIGELDASLQPKLLRVLETQTVMPVGGRERREVDVRLIAATHRDLRAMVEAGAFRQDLFFRLNVLSVPVPALRQRREDIPALVRVFLAQQGQPELEVSSETLELFTSAYDWPGNVRELRNAIARVITLGDRAPLPNDALGAPSRWPRAGAVVDPDEPLSKAKRRVVEAFEREYLVCQLDRSDGNIGQAARMSRMDRSHFKRLMRRHGLLESGDD